MATTKLLYHFWTLTAAVPLVTIGLSNLRDGEYIFGTVLVVLAIIIYGVFDYIWKGLTAE